MKRSHDAFYANEDKAAPVKDSFKMIARNIEGFFVDSGNGVTIGDIGCATGMLPGYLKSIFPNAEVIGFEYLDELLSVARADFPDLEFRKMDVTDEKSIPVHSLDVITMCGVLCIFDDAERIIQNMLQWARPGGRILIFNMFNPFDIDVFVKYRHSGDAETTELESGWNIVSQSSVSNILRRKGIENFSFTEFEISVDIEPRREDVLRSWTEKAETGNRFIVNALHLRQPFFLLEINV